MPRYIEYPPAAAALLAPMLAQLGGLSPHPGGKTGARRSGINIIVVLPAAISLLYKSQSETASRLSPSCHHMCNQTRSQSRILYR